MSNKNTLKELVTAVMPYNTFKREAYRAYCAYVSFMNGQKSLEDTREQLAPLFAAFGNNLTKDNFVTVLTVRMTSYGKAKEGFAANEQGKTRKILSGVTFNKFIVEGFREVAAAPVYAKATEPKEPAKKAKGPTKAELAAENAALKAQLANINK